MPLKIAGQEDIDISAFCIKSEQPKHFDNFKKLFGEPTRKGTNSTGWDFQKDGFGVSVWLTDPTVETTINQVKVFNLLKNNPDLLKEYEKIKDQIIDEVKKSAAEPKEQEVKKTADEITKKEQPAIEQAQKEVELARFFKTQPQQKKPKK